MTENSTNLLEVCRMCLNDVENCKNLEEQNDYLCDAIEAIFNIKVCNEDNYSTFICNICENTITAFYEYYSQVIANQNVLKRNYLKESIEPKSTDDLCYALGPNTTVVDHDTDCTDDEDDRIREVYTIKCSICENSQLYHTFELLQDHFDQVHDADEAFIYCCETKFFNRNALLSHISTHPMNAAKPIDDKLESNSQTDMYDAIKPLKQRQKKPKPNHDEKIREFFNLNCKLCCGQELFASFKLLRDHYSLVHNTRGYVECCDKKFYRKDHLIDHITNHINPGAHKCPECGKMSKNKNSLKVHMKRHVPNQEQTYQCCACPARYATKTRLTKHEYSHVGESDKNFVCDNCGKAFATKSVLAKHRLIHSAEHKFVCETCGRLFNSKGNLQLHMNNMHSSDPRPKLQCHICQSWFKNNDTLRKHIRHHTERRDYNCDQCEKVFSSKNLLWCHVRYVHSQIRKYTCSICERSFRRKLELTEHMARHAGKSLYECPKCSKSFMYSSHFSQHRKNCQVAT